MPQETAHRVEVEAAHHGVGGVRVSAIVEAHVIQTSESAKHPPASAEVVHGPVAPAVGKDELAATRQTLQHRPSGRWQLDRFRAGLGIGKDGAGAADPIPF